MPPQRQARRRRIRVLRQLQGRQVTRVRLLLFHSGLPPARLLAVRNHYLALESLPAQRPPVQAEFKAQLRAKTTHRAPTRSRPSLLDRRLLGQREMLSRNPCSLSGQRNPQRRLPKRRHLYPVIKTSALLNLSSDSLPDRPPSPSATILQQAVPLPLQKLRRAPRVPSHSAHRPRRLQQATNDRALPLILALSLQRPQRDRCLHSEQSPLSQLHLRQHLSRQRRRHSRSIRLPVRSHLHPNPTKA